jgi:hypothetical protein
MERATACEKRLQDVVIDGKRQSRSATRFLLVLQGKVSLPQQSPKLGLPGQISFPNWHGGFDSAKRDV